MREIKFRGKTNTGGWMYGSLVYSKNLQTAIYFEVGAGRVKHFNWVYVDPETVGQFTGRKDINGSDLYPGDLIQTPDSKTCDVIHRIYWNKKTCGFKLWFEGYGAAGSLMQKWINEFGKVLIGNIYDDPELLQGAKPDANV